VHQMSEQGVQAMTRLHCSLPASAGWTTQQTPGDFASRYHQGWLWMNVRAPGQKIFLLPERRLGDTSYEKRSARYMITCSWYNDYV
jgi:hypothetical protein